MAYAAVISLQKTIVDLLDSPRLSLIRPSRKIVKRVYRELMSLQQILKRVDVSSKSNTRKKLNALDARMREAVWEFEDLLQSHIYTQILPQSERSPTKVNNGAGEIKKEVVSFNGLIKSRKIYYWTHPHFEILQINLEELSDGVDSFTKMLKKKGEEYVCELGNPLPDDDVVCPSTAAANEFKMVGSSDLVAEIRRKLEPGSGFLVVPVAGMAGIGKTSIAKEIFNSVRLEFECLVWVGVGRSFQLDKLKRDILNQLDPELVEGDGGEHLLIRQILEAKRCLIVLDDVWDKHVWDELKRCFPSRCGDSRVVFTTRLQHVARYASMSWYRYKVELLDEEQSWDLLRRRVFGEEGSCPQQLIKAGKKIAQKCDGLPLMILIVARLLSEKPHDETPEAEEYWEEVAESKTSEVFTAAYEEISEVLFPSYEYLPQHLKPCFLHVGVFPQKHVVSRSKLLTMWDAEGLIETNIHRPVEQCSEIYLGELVDHNVVMRCKKSSNFVFTIGEDVKSCRLHSCFWYLCNREAKGDKFFHALTTCSDALEESVEGQRRLSVHNNVLFGINGVFDSVEDACASTARSLICCGPYQPYQVPLCFNLRLLKLLDAIQIRFYEFPIRVLQLLYLKYISLTYDGDLPASISKLWNLRTLIIHRNMSIKTYGVASYVPIEIWYMKELKHIHIMGSNLPSPGPGDSLESLLSLKGVGPETCTEEVLQRIPNLRKLGIRIELHPDDDMKALHCLQHIHVLHDLYSLKCVVVNPTLSREINAAAAAPLPKFATSLRKLHLGGMGYPWEYMSAIGSLPHLLVLKLRSYAFRGPKWEVEGGAMFKKLNYLLIEETDLVQLRVGKGCFTQLNLLYLHHCYKLRDIQWETPTPRNNPGITMIDCSPSTLPFANQTSLMVYVQSSWHGDGKSRQQS